MKKLVIMRIPYNMSKLSLNKFVSSIRRTPICETHEILFIPDNIDIINYDNDKNLIIAHSSEIGNITLENLVNYLNNVKED